MDEFEIFHFTVQGQDGQEEHRAADPFKVMRMMAHGLGGEKLSLVLQQAGAPPSPISMMAQEKLLGAICSAFGLQPTRPDGSGCTERTLMRVFKEFQLWRHEVKKNTEPSAIASTKPTAATLEENSPVPNCLPCGSTENAEITSALNQS